MALNYSVALRPNPLKKDEPAKAYATAQVNGELSLKQLSRRVSMQTTVSRADVVAVLISTVENLLDALQEGKQVDFGDLGKFRLQILNEGAESLEKFTSTNITGVNIQYIPGEDLKNIFAGLEFQPVASRKAQQAVLRAEKAGRPLSISARSPLPEGTTRNRLTRSSVSLLACTQSVCHFWLDPKVTKRSRLTLTGYFETCARCRIPTRCAQTGMLPSLATVSPLYARPLRPSKGKRRFPLISAVISLFTINY